MNLENPYRAAGTFTGPSYVARQADRDLLQAIESNLRFPYMLAPRQSGKSSLIAHVRTKLAATECVSAFVDFSTFLPGELTDFDKFLGRFFGDCLFSLGIACDFQLVSGRFLEGINFLLGQTRGKRLVVFLDEVDALQRSGFRDTFFSIIRNVFNERAVHRELRKLQFVIAGAACAEDLITDELRSPFNVGKAIQLTDFTLKETEIVCSFMRTSGVQMPADLPSLIFQNANGSVYLTQLLLEHLWERLSSPDKQAVCADAVTKLVREIVEETIQGATNNVHFTTILSNLDRNENAKRSFTRLLRQERVTKTEHETLRFLGIAGPDRKNPFRNRIYEMVFGAGGSLCQIGISPAIIEYLRRLEAATSKLELIGLGQGVQIELPIEQAYIPLNAFVARDLKNENPFHFDDKALRQRECFEDNVLLGDIFRWAKHYDSRGVLLLADPGAGKTTGARQFCWRVLKEPDLPKSLGLPAGTLPVFLRLRYLTAHHLAKGLPSFINDAMAASALSAELANPGPDLLARRGVLWVFDGLDEVVNENARVHVCNWIKQALADRPGDFFLITSRYQGYQGRVDLGPAFCQFHVKPLDPDQVAEFVDHWYRAVCRKLYGPGDAAEEKAEGLIRSLMELLRQPEYRIGRLRELPANPLMLTILCVVHHQDRNLPRRRADLYAKCVRVLVEHWRKEMLDLQQVSGFVPEAAEGVLSSVAWWLHEKENRTSLTIEELGAVADRALADLAPAAGLGRNGVEFIRRMRDESGILAMWCAGQCGFLHLTFQEYLAGLYAAREGRAESLVQHVGKSWWREVILVAVAVGSRDFAQKFFTALLQTEAVAQESAFVDQCLDEACYAVLEPFIAALRAKHVKPERQLDILRRLRQFEHDDLTAVCGELAGAAHPELSALAGEILQRAGVEVKRATVEVSGAPLEVRVDQRSGIAFIAVPAGEFDMGAGQSLNDNERPVHRVRISKPFLIGKYPVTNQEYHRFLKANPKTRPPVLLTNSRFNDPKQPVVGVSWDDAQAFCRWAGCRLPTESEWEYACRAGSQQRFCFGADDSKLEEYAWFATNSGGKLHAVGEKTPNSWGLFDMHGNVWEWCQDRFGSYPKRAVTDPVGATSGTERVLRGGSFLNDPAYLSCSFRNNFPPDDRNRDIGFRVVCVDVSAR